MKSAIHTEALTKTFRDVSALNGLDLDVPKGAVYALVGPNGAGKSTAIKIFMNILHATDGRAEVLGLDSEDLSGSALCSIGYVSENQKLPEWMRVDELLAYARGFYPSWDRALEERLVQAFDLPRRRKLKALSRGMRMKAALASSLAYRPRLVVMDEPFSGLDPLVRDELINELRKRAEGTTLLVCSHDLGEVESLATHVGYIEKGRLLFSEELISLTSRFRAIEIRLDALPALPDVLPESWIRMEASSLPLRFVDTRYDAERTPAEISRVFGQVQNTTYAPMSLRSIFLAVAKTNVSNEQRGL